MSDLEFVIALISETLHFDDWSLLSTESRTSSMSVGTHLGCSTVRVVIQAVQFDRMDVLIVQ